MYEDWHEPEQAGQLPDHGLPRLLQAQLEQQNQTLNTRIAGFERQLQVNQIAYDKLTGDMKWKTPYLGNESYASPSVVKIDGKIRILEGLMHRTSHHSEGEKFVIFRDVNIPWI